MIGTKSKDEIIKAKILRGADKLFQKQGLNKTTMEDIAREAGKGKSTLYYYFKSKEEIFDVIVQNEKNKLFGIIQEAVANAPTAREKLNVFLTIRLRRVKEWTNLYNVMVQEAMEALSGDRGCAARYRKQYDQKETNIIKSILQYGIVTGEFRVFSEEELDMMAFVMMSAQHGLELDLVIYDKLDELTPRLSFFLELLVSGIKRE
jgi:AcrR family transcriptional regulator